MILPDGRVVVRSYRTVFRFERRLYRFDRWRLPVRGGVPLRALLYTPAVYVAWVALAGIPGVGMVMAALPDPLRWGLVPLALVAGLLRLELDGRPAHRALWARVRWRLGPRWRAGLRACRSPGPVPLAVGVLVVRPDWRAGRPGRVRGPVRLRVRARTSSPGSVPARRLVLELDPATKAWTVRVPAGGVLELR
jgi:hypothetical protein